MQTGQQLFRVETGCGCAKARSVERYFLLREVMRQFALPRELCGALGDAVECDAYRRQVRRVTERGAEHRIKSGAVQWKYDLFSRRDLARLCQFGAILLAAPTRLYVSLRDASGPDGTLTLVVSMLATPEALLIVGCEYALRVEWPALFVADHVIACRRLIPALRDSCAVVITGSPNGCGGVFTLSRQLYALGLANYRVDSLAVPLLSGSAAFHSLRALVAMGRLYFLSPLLCNPTRRPLFEHDACLEILDQLAVFLCPEKNRLADCPSAICGALQAMHELGGDAECADAIRAGLAEVARQ
jgi:hypothetical protein